MSKTFYESGDKTSGKSLQTGLGFMYEGKPYETVVVKKHDEQSVAVTAVHDGRTCLLFLPLDQRLNVVVFRGSDAETAPYRVVAYSKQVGTAYNSAVFSFQTEELARGAVAKLAEAGWDRVDLEHNGKSLGRVKGTKPVAGGWAWRIR